MKEVRDAEKMAEKMKREHERREHERREQERRELHHLVTSSVPSPPYGGISILNPTLTVFGADPRAVLSAHLLASYAAANPDARFPIPIPISIAVSNPGQQIYQSQPPPKPQLDIISSWVTDQKEKSKKQKEREHWEKSNQRNDLVSPETLIGKKKKKVGEKATIIPTERPSRQNQDITHNNNNNHEHLNQNQSNQPSRDKQFTCQVCNRGFGYKHVLQNHERTHTGEKPFECTTCQKKFTRDHHLKTHMRLHTGEKPYQCPHCVRQFVQVANLRRHLRVHTGEKPFACDLCKSKFSDSNQLKSHMLIHKREKPYDCQNCQGRFRKRHHLLTHKCLQDSFSPPNGTKRERKSRETRRIIRLETAGAGPGDEPMDFLPGVPEQTHPEDLSTHNLNFSSSHSSCSASPSPPSGESHGSVGLYSVGSSDPPGYSTDDEIASSSHTTGKSDDASPSFMSC